MANRNPPNQRPDGSDETGQLAERLQLPAFLSDVIPNRDSILLRPRRVIDPNRTEPYELLLYRTEDGVLYRTTLTNVAISADIHLGHIDFSVAATERFRRILMRSQTMWERPNIFLYYEKTLDGGATLRLELVFRGRTLEFTATEEELTVAHEASSP